MRMKIMSLVGLLAIVAFAPQARAQTASSEDACEAVASFLGPVSGAIVAAPWITSGWGSVFAAGMAGLGNRFSSPAISRGCQNYLNSWQQQTNFNYNEFVRTICNGNPYGCPNGWNSMGSFPGTPRDCSKFIACMLPLAIRPDGSLSVQDLINAGTFVDISSRSGYWEFSRYGYLVGHSPVGPDPFFDPY
jgi:hypothetical protein